MITEPGLYKLKEEFFVINEIPLYQYKKRREDLLEWGKDFYDYEIIGTKPIMIKIMEVFGEYKPLPKKMPDMAEKIADYDNYVKEHLPKDFQPESKAHMARGAISAFGLRKYNHTSDAAVARRYVGPAMEEYGEKSETHVWVDYRDYKELDAETLQLGIGILNHNHIGEREAANAFYKQEQGMDITREKQSFKKSLEEMKAMTGIIPVKVAKGRIAAMRGLN